MLIYRVFRIALNLPSPKGRGDRDVPSPTGGRVGDEGLLFLVFGNVGWPIGEEGIVHTLWLLICRVLRIALTLPSPEGRGDRDVPSPAGGRVGDEGLLFPVFSNIGWPIGEEGKVHTLWLLICRVLRIALTLPSPEGRGDRDVPSPDGGRVGDEGLLFLIFNSFLIIFLTGIPIRNNLSYSDRKNRILKTDDFHDYLFASIFLDRQ